MTFILPILVAGLYLSGSQLLVQIQLLSFDRQHIADIVALHEFSQITRSAKHTATILDRYVVHLRNSFAETGSGSIAIFPGQSRRSAVHARFGLNKSPIIKPARAAPVHLDRSAARDGIRACREIIIVCSPPA